MCCEAMVTPSFEAGRKCQRGSTDKHFLLDAVSDALQQLGLDHVSLRVNRDLDDHIALHACRYIRARDRRIGKDFRQRGHHFIPRNRRAWHAPVRRTAARGLLGRILSRGLVRSPSVRIRLGRLRCWLRRQRSTKNGRCSSGADCVFSGPTGAR